MNLRSQYAEVDLHRSCLYCEPQPITYGYVFVCKCLHDALNVIDNFAEYVHKEHGAHDLLPPSHRGSLYLDPVM